MQALLAAPVLPAHHIFERPPLHLFKCPVAIAHNHIPPAPRQMRCNKPRNLHILKGIHIFACRTVCLSSSRCRSSSRCHSSSRYRTTSRYRTCASILRTCTAALRTCTATLRTCVAELRQLQEVLREGNGVRLEVAGIVVLFRKSSDYLYAVASLYAIA